MRKIKGCILPETKFTFPFRLILSGSSGSGKTHFAGKLLQRNNLFCERVSNVVYYYPCYLRKAPVNWENELQVPVSYSVGLPTKSDLVNLPKNTCVVIDDCYDLAVKSSAIDHLFRVISSKHNICVMIMTQNNFTRGKYGREIRNSCNFSVLFRNCCDASINENVARMAGLKDAYSAASGQAKTEMFPYMFLDQSQQGQLSSYRLYTDIFSQNKISWSLSGMKGYVIGESDFETYFSVITKGGDFEASLNANPQKYSTNRDPTSHQQRKNSQTRDQVEPSSPPIQWWDADRSSDSDSSCSKTDSTSCTEKIKIEEENKSGFEED